MCWVGGGAGGGVLVRAGLHCKHRRWHRAGLFSRESSKCCTHASHPADVAVVFPALLLLLLPTLLPPSLPLLQPLLQSRAASSTDASGQYSRLPGDVEAPAPQAAATTGEMQRTWTSLFLHACK